MKRNKTIIISLIMCIFCMGFIFINSAKSGVESNHQSGVIENIVEKIVPDPIKVYLRDNKLFKSINYSVRKSAHMIEFFILAIIIATLLFELNIKGRHAVVYILFIVLLYAVLDEYHQMYVPGRTSNVKDIVIDFTGGIFGTIVFYITYYKYIIRRKSPLSKIRFSKSNKR